MKMIGIIVIAFIFSTLWAQAADDYPNKPIQLICPMPPGGPLDLNARIVGEKMSEYLGQRIIVINKPGGGTSAAWKQVIGSKPDGYTLFTNPAQILVTIPMTMPTLSLKMSDFIPVSRMVSYNFFIMVNKDLPVTTLQELVAHAKKNPHTLSYGGATYGSASHIIGELLKLGHELDLQFVPFSGESRGIMALLGNHIHIGIFTIFQWSYVKSDRGARALAVFSAKRDPLLPEVPTALEQGFPDLVLPPGRFLLFAPAKTPISIIKRLEAALEKALQDKNVQEKIGKMQLTVDFLGSENTQTSLEDEARLWLPVVKKANIVMD